MNNLLYWAVVLFVVAIVAAFLGFGGIAGTAMGGAKIVFWAALIIGVVMAVLGMMRRA
ncbi:MAG TPA: DUF1328 domain-containing protein [Aestuariivirga sp.]|nr:DUF1328 domain-containing protein [Aestuariivirga sp.]